MNFVQICIRTAFMKGINKMIKAQRSEKKLMMYKKLNTSS